MHVRQRHGQLLRTQPRDADVDFAALKKQLFHIEILFALFGRFLRLRGRFRFVAAGGSIEIVHNLGQIITPQAALESDFRSLYVHLLHHDRLGKQRGRFHAHLDRFHCDGRGRLVPFRVSDKQLAQLTAARQRREVRPAQTDLHFGQYRTGGFHAFLDDGVEGEEHHDQRDHEQRDKADSDSENPFYHDISSVPLPKASTGFPARGTPYAYAKPGGFLEPDQAQRKESAHVLKHFSP